jgi:prepilin-type N-terminal cleavage/methylation domain-containing protein
MRKSFKRLINLCCESKKLTGTTCAQISSNTGMTLVEVIVGMVILTMLVAGLNAGVISLVNTNRSSKEISAASNFGYEKLEELRRSSYDDIEVALGLQEGNYLINRYVTGDGSTQKSIKLEILWPASSQNPKHSISLSTIIAKP